MNERLPPPFLAPEAPPYCVPHNTDLFPSTGMVLFSGDLAWTLVVISAEHALSALPVALAPSLLFSGHGVSFGLQAGRMALIQPD